MNMEDIKCSARGWEDMAIDVLLKIIGELNMIEILTFSQVCSSWRRVCSNPFLWSTLDLGLLKSNFIPTPQLPPYIWVDDKSKKRLTKVLKIAMVLGGGNVTCIVFHFDLYMRDEHLNYIAERCPHIKRLVLPTSKLITWNGICQALHRWRQLESMTMSSFDHASYIMKLISRNCKNFTQLKLMGALDIQLASSILANIPKLEVLSVRCSIVTEEALLFVLKFMKNLEVLNISHCILLQSEASPQQITLEQNLTIIQQASRLREFFYCQSDSCRTCKRMVRDEGYMRWWKYEELFWRHDEVGSFCLGGYGLIGGCLRYDAPTYGFKTNYDKKHNR